MAGTQSGLRTGRLSLRRRSIQRTLWGLTSFCLLTGCLLLSWLLLARVDFAYPAAYKMLDIGLTIEGYAPHNRHKNWFELTDETEHHRLFSAIVTAIHRDGEGLEEITYHLPNGAPIDTLLHEDEVVHLQDVARLIHAGRIIGTLALIIGLLLNAWLWWRRIPPPSPLALASSYMAGITAGAAAVVLIGPRRVFSGLHALLFPPENPWFFNYADSLMTTLMQAPYLFGFISILWGAMTLLAFAATLGLLYALCRRRQPVPGGE